MASDIALVSQDGDGTVLGYARSFVDCGFITLRVQWEICTEANTREMEVAYAYQEYLLNGGIPYHITTKEL